MADNNDTPVAVPEQAYTDDKSKSIEMESGTLKDATSSARNMEDTRTKGFVVLVAAAAALGGLIFGYDIGGAGATFVMTGFREHFQWGTLYSPLFRASCSFFSISCFLFFFSSFLPSLYL